MTKTKEEWETIKKLIDKFFKEFPEGNVSLSDIGNYDKLVFQVSLTKKL